MMAKKRSAEGLKERTKLVKQRRSKQNHERLSKKRNAELEDQTDIAPEADDDFQKPSKKCRTKEPVKRPTKEFVEYSHTKLKMRCSPFEFMNSIQKFTEAQKSEVKNMGFGAILTMNIDSVATGLGYWLLMNYDEETNTVNVGNQKINITASKVQEVFGIPMGKIQVLEKNKPRKGAHSTIDEFKNQFDTSRISVGKILPLIEQLQDGGRLFKLNFLVVWNTVFGEITKSTTVNQRFLLAIEDESEIPEMDWCSYMIDCLRRTKESWRGYNDQYNGPIALLAVLYTHEYNKRHKPQDSIRKPALSYITSESLDDMETFLFNNGPLIDNEVEEENIQLNKGRKEGLKERTKLVKGRRSKQKHDRLSKKMNAEIEDQIAIAPESDVNFQKPSKKARTKESVKIPTKEFIQYRHIKLKMRCSPFEFISSIQKFTEAQKSEVKNMGFGAILTMNIDSVATGLGYWLLMNYDEETNTVNVGNRKIKITASKVHEVFGIPMGKIQVLEKNRPRKGAHSTIDEFKNQFDTSRISVGKILPLIEQLQDGGRLFKLNFLVVWNTVFGEITKSTTVNQRFLLAIEDESEIPEMDWCSYMIDCLRRTKESWRGYNDQYNGPIALLTVLYTHEYNKRHKPQDPIRKPALSYITSESLDDMETFLFNNGPLIDDEVEEENIQLNKGPKEGLKERTKLVKGRRSKQKHDRLSKKMNAEIEDQIAIVPESDVDFQKPSKKARTKEPVKRPTKEFIPYTHTKLKMRCSPFEFISSIQKFTEAQKSEVKNMGFGAILTMNIDSVATGMGYWLLMNYDEETNTVNVGNRKIKITASKVHEVFGIPMGKIQVLEKNRPRKGAHSTIDEFKNQFDTSRISVGKILPLIEQLQDGGRLFKLNFLVLWNTVFGEITKSTTVNQRFLLAIEDESEIPEMDWCSYMIDCLKRTKESWRGYNDQYNGPIALLSVLYTHEYNKRHKPQGSIKKPAISYITSESLDDMETFLFNNGPLTDDEVEEENIQLTKGTKGNDDQHANKSISTEKQDKEIQTEIDSEMNNDDVDGDYTLPPVKTRQAKFIFGNEQDKVIHSESDNGTHDDNLDADYTIYEHAPLKSDMKLGTATQMFVDDCITQPEPTSIATYVDQEQHEASDKAKKAWISTMDKNIKKYKKIVAEMGEMVKDARSKYSRVPEIMERCCQWENALNVTQQPQAQKTPSVEDPNVDHEDNNQNVVSLAESTQSQKSDNEVGKKDGNISVGLENGHQLELADPLLGTVVRIEGDGQKLKASTESTLEISDTGLHKSQTVEKCRYAEHEIGQKLHTLADSALRDK